MAEVPQLKAQMISCGHEYTMVLTKSFELIITGRLPFIVNKKDYLSHFE